MPAGLRRLLVRLSRWYRRGRTPAFDEFLARAEEELAPTLLRVRSLERALSGRTEPRPHDPRAEGAVPGSLRAVPAGAGESARMRVRA